jgi:flagellar motility protein MotE (MotC chaperone)
MNECPRVKQRYELNWEYFDNVIRLHELEMPELDEVNKDIGNLNTFQRKLQNMIVRFDAVFKEVENKIDAVNLRTTACEENILRKVSARFATDVTHHMTRISDYASTTIQNFQSQIQKAVDNHLAIHSETIATMQQNSYSRLSEAMAKMERRLQEQEQKYQNLCKQAEEMEHLFYQKYEQAMEEAIQEIYDCADDATEKFNEHVATAMESPPPAQPAPEPGLPHVASRWNIDPEYRRKLQNFTPKTYQDPQEVKTNNASETHNNDVTPEWDKEGPGFQPMPRMRKIGTKARSRK